MSHKLVKLFASLFLSLVVVSASFFPASAAPPFNDNFANAELITTLPFSASIDITEATTEPGEPQLCYPMNNTVWYSFTPTQTMKVQVDTNGSTTWSFVTVLLASGPGFSGLSYIGCNAMSSSVKFTAEAGQTYYLQAGSGWGSVGTVQVNLTPVLPPPNDNFENAQEVQALPFDTTLSIEAATIQPGEPAPSCAYYGPFSNSIWFSFTPETSGLYLATIPMSWFSPVTAVYTGGSLETLGELKCQNSYGGLSIQANAGSTYYFQVGTMYSLQNSGFLQFTLDVAPPPIASFVTFPMFPSKFNTIQFYSTAFDQAGIGIASYEWDFGDGSSSSQPWPYHQYAADGDYQAVHTVTTYDGRTGTTTQTVQVRTHDVTVARIVAPKSAKAGQTSKVSVYVSNNTPYAETVNVVLYRSVFGDWEHTEAVKSLTLPVPVSAGQRLTVFSFTYTFTAEDAQIGKVTFWAKASLQGIASDAFSFDNTAIAPPTRVSR